MANKTIMIVEDDVLHMKLFNDVLEYQGYRTLRATDADSAVPLARQHHPDMTAGIIAVLMPGEAGHDIVSGVGQHPADGVAHVAGHEDGNDAGGHVGPLMPRSGPREREFSGFIRFIQSYIPFTSPSYDFHAAVLII